MEFNVSKCKVVHYGRCNIGHSYKMQGQLLNEAVSEKDLGVTFTNDLKVATQCKEVYAKANQMLGLVSRTIQFRNPSVLMNLYKSLVRPHLDYCSTVWSPQYRKDISLLERVQHRFTRLFPHLRELPYEERLRRLGLWSLEERRNRADLIELFKMVKGLSAVPWSLFFDRAEEDSVTRGHSLKLKKKHCHSNIRLHFFSQRVLNRWNSLTQEEVDATSIDSFKNRLERRRHRQMDFYTDN